MQTYCYHCMKEMLEPPLCAFCGHSNEEDHGEVYHVKPGSVLADRYMVGNAIGEGGFGITYIGMDTTLGKRVAIKEFYPSGAANRTNLLSDEVIVSKSKTEFFQKGVVRFLEEAKNVAQFYEEEGIVDVLDYFEANHTAYIVMEYVEGKTLKDCVNQNGKFRLDKLIELLTPVMKSLSVVHARGIIHRDISPDNIMLTNRGKMKLMDFGSARYFTNEEREMSVILKQGFAPIEQYSRNSEQGPYSDVYALCATIYACITGTIPADSLDRMKNDTLVPPSRLGVPVLPHQERALMHGLALNAANRTQSMAALIREFTVVPVAAPAPKAKDPAKPAKNARSNLKQPTPSVRPPQAQNLKQPTPSIRPPQAQNLKQPTPSVRPPQAQSLNHPTPSIRPPQAQSLKHPTPSARPPQAQNPKQPAAQIPLTPSYMPPIAKKESGKKKIVLISIIVGVLIIAGAVTGIVFGTKGCNNNGTSVSSSTNIHQIVGKNNIVLATDDAIDTTDSAAQSKLESYISNHSSNFQNGFISNDEASHDVYALGNTLVVEEKLTAEIDREESKTLSSISNISFNSEAARRDTGVDNFVFVVAVIDKDNNVLLSKVFK